jgi:lysophospholipase L1-like esterase
LLRDARAALLPRVNAPAAAARHFRTGFFATGAVLAVFLAPLFSHQSDAPRFGPYSARYAIALASLVLAALALAAYVGRRCRARESFAPAQAAVLSILSVFVTLLAAECTLRVFQPEGAETFATYRQWGHRKSMLFGFEADFDHSWTIAGATYHTDASGFRRHVQDPEWRKNGAAKRIFTLGESSVFGFGLEDDETWPHRLEEKLAAQALPQRHVVVNAGNNGHNSLQSTLRFYLRVAPERPDHVVYYAAVNDVMNARPEHDAIWITPDMLFIDSLSAYLRKTRQYQNLYARSVLGVMLANAWDAFFGVPPAPPAELAWDPSPKGTPKEMEARFERNLLTLLDMCRRAGATLVLTTFIYDEARLEPSYAAGVRRRNEATRAVARREGVPLVDLERAFAEVPGHADYFFPDAYHPNERGAEWIASVLAERLPELLAPGSAAPASGAGTNAKIRDVSSE